MKRLALVVCFAALVMGVGCSPRQTAADVEKELAALEEQWMDAYVKGDASALERIEADDAVLTDTDGNFFTKADDIAEVKAGVYVVKSWATEERKVRLYGDTAVVYSIGRTQGTYKGKSFDSRARATETWLRRDGRWQCAASHSTRIVGDLSSAEAEVNTVLDKMIKANEAGDLALLSEMISRDPELVIYGTDAAERWVGYGPFAEAMEKMFKSFGETKIVSRDRVIQVAPTGNVAWFSEIWDQSGKAQGRPYAMKGLRLTGVLEKQDGKWVVAQWHGSVPVAGQAVKY